jgi:nicotinate-nucleotide adenylyltransferase
MIIANYMATKTDLEEVWMVVSPHNPHKPKNKLAKDYDRLHLVNLAIGDNTKLKSSNIEFGLPKPSYTIDTLTHLKEKFPKYEFVLLMGGDNIATLKSWKNYEAILNGYEIYVYKRPTYELGELENHPKVKLFEAPMLDISATYIRKLLKEKCSIQYLVPDEVFHYLSTYRMYE